MVKPTIYVCNKFNKNCFLPIYIMKFFYYNIHKLLYSNMKFMTDTLTKTHNKDTIVQSKEVASAAESRQVEYKAETLYTVLEEKEAKEGKKLSLKILELINKLEKAGVFFHVIDGVIYINGAAIENLIENLNSISELLEQIVDHKIKIQPFYIYQEGVEIPENLKGFVLPMPKITQSETAIEGEDGKVEVDVIKTVEENREAFEEQNKCTNSLEYFETKQALLVSASNTKREFLHIDKSKAEQIVDANEKMVKDGYHIVLKMNGKIMSLPEIIYALEGRSTEEIRKMFRIGDNYQRQLKRHSIKADQLDEVSNFFAILLSTPQFKHLKDIEEAIKKAEAEEAAKKALVLYNNPGTREFDKQKEEAKQRALFEKRLRKELQKAREGLTEFSGLTNSTKKQLDEVKLDGTAVDGSDECKKEKNEVADAKKKLEEAVKVAIESCETINTELSVLDKRINGLSEFSIDKVPEKAYGVLESIEIQEGKISSAQKALTDAKEAAEKAEAERKKQEEIETAKKNGEEKRLKCAEAREKEYIDLDFTGDFEMLFLTDEEKAARKAAEDAAKKAAENAKKELNEKLQNAQEHLGELNKLITDAQTRLSEEQPEAETKSGQPKPEDEAKSEKKVVDGSSESVDTGTDNPVEKAERALKKAKEEKDNAIAELKTAMETANGKRDAIKDQLDQIGKDIDGLSGNTVEEVKGNADRISGKIDTANDSTDEAKNKLDEAIEKFNEQVKQINGEIETKKQALEDARKAEEEAAKKKADEEAAKKAKEEAERKKQETLESLQNELNLIRDNISLLDKVKKALKQVAEKPEEKAKLESERLEKRKEEDGKKKALEDLQQQLQQLNETNDPKKIEGLSNQINNNLGAADRQGEIKKLLQQALELKRAEAVENLNALQESIDSAQRQLDQAKLEQSKLEQPEPEGDANPKSTVADGSSESVGTDAGDTVGEAELALKTAKEEKDKAINGLRVAIKTARTDHDTIKGQLNQIREDIGGLSGNEEEVKTETDRISKAITDKNKKITDAEGELKAAMGAVEMAKQAVEEAEIIAKEETARKEREKAEEAARKAAEVTRMLAVLQAARETLKEARKKGDDFLQKGPIPSDGEGKEVEGGADTAAVAAASAAAPTTGAAGAAADGKSASEPSTPRPVAGVTAGSKSMKALLGVGTTSDSSTPVSMPPSKDKSISELIRELKNLVGNGENVEDSQYKELFDEITGLEGQLKLKQPGDILKLDTEKLKGETEGVKIKVDGFSERVNKLIEQIGKEKTKETSDSECYFLKMEKEKKIREIIGGVQNFLLRQIYWIGQQVNVQDESMKKKSEKDPVDECEVAHNAIDEDKVSLNQDFVYSYLYGVLLRMDKVQLEKVKKNRGRFLLGTVRKESELNVSIIFNYEVDLCKVGEFLGYTLKEEKDQQKQFESLKLVEKQLIDFSMVLCKQIKRKIEEHNEETVLNFLKDVVTVVSDGLSMKGDIDQFDKCKKTILHLMGHHFDDLDDVIIDSKDKELIEGNKFVDLFSEDFCENKISSFLESFDGAKIDPQQLMQLKKSIQAVPMMVMSFAFLFSIRDIFECYKKNIGDSPVNRMGFKNHFGNVIQLQGDKFSIDVSELLPNDRLILLKEKAVGFRHHK